MAGRTVRTLWIGLIVLGLGAFEAPGGEPLHPAVSWERTYGGAGGGDDAALCIRETADAGYILAGYAETADGSGGAALLLKMTPQGDLEWQREFSKLKKAASSHVEQTTDGGYILSGWATSLGWESTMAHLIRTDAAGSLIGARSPKRKGVPTGGGPAT
jgi:hypothetical protein